MRGYRVRGDVHGGGDVGAEQLPFALLASQANGGRGRRGAHQAHHLLGCHPKTKTNAKLLHVTFGTSHDGCTETISEKEAEEEDNEEERAQQGEQMGGEENHPTRKTLDNGRRMRTGTERGRGGRRLTFGPDEGGRTLQEIADLLQRRVFPSAGHAGARGRQRTGLLHTHTHENLGIKTFEGMFRHRPTVPDRLAIASHANQCWTCCWLLI